MDIRKKVLETADWKTDEKDADDAVRSSRIGLVLRIALAAAAILFLFSLQVRPPVPYFAGTAAVLLAAAYYGHVTVFSRRLRSYLIRDCDPAHFLSYYTALLSGAGRQKKWEGHIYNMAEGLFYAGEFEKAEKMLTLYETDCRSAEGDFRHDLLGTLLACRAGDPERLHRYAGLLPVESSRVRMNGELCDALDEALALPGYLEMEKSGQWKDLYEAVSHAKFYSASPLGQLKRQVWLSRAAKGMKDQKKAAEHEAYVQQHRGSTFYR